jgi:hypothetical protein
MKMEFKKNMGYRPIKIGISTEKKHVYVKMDLMTDTCKPTRLFWLEVNNQEEAQMMSERLNEVLNRWTDEIAKDCLIYLTPRHRSELKRKLRGWDIRKEGWNKCPDRLSLK